MSSSLGRGIWQPPPQPPRPPNKRPAKSTIHTPTVTKRGKTERECSVCKVWKSLQDGFSKSQRNKGDNAKCKGCIDAQQKCKQQLSTDEKEARRKKVEDDRKQQRDKKEARRKKVEDDRKLAAEKRKREEEERKAAARILEVEEKKKAIAANEKKETEHYGQMKKEYELHVQKLTSEGRDIEKEMITPSNLVYIITSINTHGGDKFSPHLQGIFTTCQKAKDCAHKVFESTSMSYRDGKFDANENRTAKCDTTEFLIPGVECNVRVLFEIFGEVNNMRARDISCDKGECNAVGITAIPMDTDDIAGMDLPFLRTLTWRQEYDALTKGTPVAGGTEVFPVFAHIPARYHGYFRIGDPTDVNICGVFRKRERAIKCSQEERKEMLQVQKANSPIVYNGLPFYQMLLDNCNTVSTLSVILDTHEGGERELGFGSKIWMKTDVEWNDIYETRL